MKTERSNRNLALALAPRVPSEHDLDELTAKTTEMTIHERHDSTEDRKQEKSTEDLIKLLDSLKIGNRKWTQGSGRGDLKSKGPKNGEVKSEYIRRGSGSKDDPNRTNQNTGSTVYFVGQNGTKLEPSWSPKSSGTIFNYGIKQNFAPSMNQSCAVWTEAQRKNRLNELHLREHRIINAHQSRDVIDGVRGDFAYSLDNISDDILETDEPFMPHIPPVNERVFDFLSNEEDPYLDKGVYSPPSVGLAESRKELQLIQEIWGKKLSETGSVYNFSGIKQSNDMFDFHAKPQLNGHAEVLHNSNTQKFTKKFESSESKPSPPKQANIDAMYDKDIDDDNILHSMIIANASENLVKEVLHNLKHDGEDVLQKIINDQNHLSRTPLFLAVMDCKLEIVKLLLEFGADPNIQGKVLITMDQYELRAPLHLVAEMGDHTLKIMETLVDCDRTDLDIRSLSDRLVPLHLALMSHRIEQVNRPCKNCEKCIQELINAGADTDIEDDRSSKTPLMMAIDTLDINIVKLFLTADSSHKQADIRLKLQAATRGGDTPLHIAAGVRLERRLKQQLLRLLIRHGADTNIENNIKELPEVIATKELWKATFRC